MGATEIDPALLPQPAHKLRTSAVGRQTLIERGADPEALQRYTDGTRRQDGRTGRTRLDKVSAFRKRLFIGWDGEGITDDDGSHRYVILANSRGAVVTGHELDTGACLELLLTEAAKDPDAANVIFAGGYDVNMILKPTLTRGQARLLADNNACTLYLNDKRYKIEYYPRHSMTITEGVYDTTLGKFRRDRTMTLWDVFGFFQSSFVKACRRILPADDLKVLDWVESMKGRRSSFTDDDLTEMLEYCREELRLLDRLMVRTAEHHDTAGIVLTRWDGAGASASSVLRAHKIKEHMAPTPDDIAEAVQSAYAGGRIERYRFGRFDGPITTLDIRSAYPWGATLLPSLKGGNWIWSDQFVPGQFAVWDITYRGRVANTLHPFFWRSHDGRICYPQTTKGWYWSPEVEIALATVPESVTIGGGWVFIPSNSTQPFGFIPTLFRNRKTLDRQEAGRGWPLKLALNSLYGKLAQQIGGQHGKPPSFHQLEWAGYITSATRARMYEIGCRYVDRLIGIETDGVTLIGEPDEWMLDRCGDHLGEYELDAFDGGIWVQSGIYWLRTNGEWLAPKVRGIGANILTRGSVLRAWEKDGYPEPNSGTITAETTRFQGMVASSVTDKRWERWCRWLTEPRLVAISPAGKRIHGACSCDGALHDTVPTGGGSRSALHRLEWSANVASVGSEWADDEPEVIE